MMVVGGWCWCSWDQPAHAPSDAPIKPLAHELTPIYPIPTQPPCKVSAPSGIALQWKRSQDYCFNTVEIEDPPTPQPNAIKSLANWACVTLHILVTTSLSDRVVRGELYARTNKIVRGMGRVTDALFVKLLTALGY